MKQIILGTVVLLSTVVSFASPRLLVGEEKERIVKALGYAVQAAGDLNCNIVEQGVPRQIESKGSEMMTYLSNAIKDGRHVYLNDAAGAQPVIQITGKTAGGRDHTSSLISDDSYQKIIKFQFVESVDTEYNAGNILNPDFQIRKVAIFTSSCTPKK